MLTRKTIGFLIKIGIVALALFFLYQQLNVKSGIDKHCVDDIITKLKGNYIVVILVIFMMFLNCFLEALKWRFLISKIEKVSIKRSLRAIFSHVPLTDVKKAITTENIYAKTDLWIRFLKILNKCLV